MLEAWPGHQVTPGAEEGKKAALPFVKLPRPVEALLRLLGWAAMSGEPGRMSLLHACFLYTLHTVTTYRLVRSSVFSGLQKMNGGTPLAEVIIGYFGLPITARWLALTATFARGRRNFTAALADIRGCLADLAQLPGLAQSLRGAGRLAVLLWGVTVLVSAATMWVVAEWLGLGTVCDTPSWTCAVTLFDCLGYSLLIFCFHLIPVKFILAGRLTCAGFVAVNGAIQAIADSRSRPGHREHQQLTELRVRLSRCFQLLTDGMQWEILHAAAAGVLLQISLCIDVLAMLRTGLSPLGIVGCLFLLVTMGLTLGGPCEVCQRALRLAADSRRLLLQLEIRRPELARQAALLQEVVSHDMETLGDLGLFRLRRATLLSISSTILTCFIILLQFSEAGKSESE